MGVRVGDFVVSVRFNGVDPAPCRPVLCLTNSNLSLHYYLVRYPSQNAVLMGRIGSYSVCLASKLIFHHWYNVGNQ